MSQTKCVPPWELKNLLLVPSAQIHTSLHKVFPSELKELAVRKSELNPSFNAGINTDTKRCLRLSGLAGEQVSIQVGWIKFASSVESNPGVYIRLKWFSETTSKNAENLLNMPSKVDFPAEFLPIKNLAEQSPEKSLNGNLICTDKFVSYPQISAYFVELVPVTVPGPVNPDDGYLFSEPALAPDRLVPLSLQKRSEDEQWLHVFARQQGCNTIWLDLQLPVSPSVSVTSNSENEALRTYKISIEVFTIDAPGLPSDFQDGNKLTTPSTDLCAEIMQINFPLSRPNIINTQWMHTDSLAAYHNVEPWSEEHWRVVSAHLESMARMGVNSTMIPIWTPSLDIEVGTYRKNVQLLEIIRHKDGYYRLDFSKAERFVGLLKTYGFIAVEVPPLFTQWGAKSCPRFYIKDSENTLQTGSIPYFGWESPATDPDYQQFLHEILPPIRTWLEGHFGSQQVFFHISDEPNESQLNSYRQARAQVNEQLLGAQVIDALSNPRYLDQVEIPVVATDAVSAFRRQGVEPNWVYYCVSQTRQVANRFVAQRSIRHRALGFQLYKNKAAGFLHWAFNFYNSQYSRFSICPYTDNSAGGGFISGDSFVVYPHRQTESLYNPAESWLYESIRHRIIAQSWNDLAVCQQAEKIIGRAAVLAIIDPDGDLDYQQGWVNEAEHLCRRQSLDIAVAAALAANR